ncbi:UNVERIFIED_CONTAM: DNA mismatch repair protein MSH5 [Sesamum latifolium]|uniref:DNA mismatch repair protein MSH5 n=1 Tax=Sesamum latifolium TaxID=2727402 RepID=A0AAW2VG17_9LAMI
MWSLRRGASTVRSATFATSAIVVRDSETKHDQSRVEWKAFALQLGKVGSWEVYMACIMHGQRVGISYYDSSICQLHVLEFWEDGNQDLPLVEMGT